MEQDSKISKFEKLKEMVNDKGLKKAIEDKIDKLSNKKTIEK